MGVLFMAAHIMGTISLSTEAKLLALLAIVGNKFMMVP